MREVVEREGSAGKNISRGVGWARGADVWGGIGEIC